MHMCVTLYYLSSSQSRNHTWKKVDYILAFSEWLYTHQYPVQDTLSHLQWALTLLLQSGMEEGGKVEEEEGVRKGEKGEGGTERGEGGQIEGEVTRSASGVRVLEKVVCVHVMMAQLQGQGSCRHRESCRAALAHCCLIWKVGRYWILQLYTRRKAPQSGGS